MVAVHVVDPQEGDFTAISTAICTCVCVLMLREMLGVCYEMMLGAC